MALLPRFRLPTASLHTKLIVTLSVLVVVVTAGSATLLIERERGERLHRLEERATRIADLLEQSLAQELWNVDSKAIQRQLDALAPNPEMAEVTVTAVGYGTVATVGPRNVSDATGGVVRVRPVTYPHFEGSPAQTIGEVRVVLTRAEAEAAIARARWAILAMAAAVVLTLHAATSVLLNRLLRTPITRLEAMVDRLAAGDLDARCPVDSADELGRLAEHVNVMADRLRESTGRLRDSEIRFRTFVDHATDALFLHDDQLTVIDVNRQAWESLGYSREELIGMHPRDFEVGLDEGPLARLAERVRAGETVTFESLHRRKDGTVFPVEVRAHRFQQGERRFRLSLVRDIAERKRAEAELRASEERFRTLVQFSFDVYWETDAQHRFTRQEFAEGLADAPTPGSEIGKTRWEVPYLEPDEEAWRKHRATLDAHLPFRDFELARPAPDGGTRYVSVSGLPVFDPTGRFLGYRGVGRHITDRKRAEQALRQSEAYLREAERLSHTGSWAFDVAGNKYVYLSEECFRIFEFDGQEGLPNRDRVSRLIAPEDWDRVNTDLETSLREKVDNSSEFRITLPSGAVKHVHATRHPVLNDAGDVVKVVGTVIDMTERKRVEAELRGRQELLDLAQNAARAVAFDWYIGARESENRWSPELEAMYGLEPGTFDRTYEGWKTLVHPDDWPAVKVAINRAHESGDVAAEYRVIHKDGTMHWLRAKGRMFFDAKGQPERMVGFMIDVTDWRRAEEALRESETRFRAFVDHAADAFFMLDFDRRTILDVNRRACESLGYTRDELIGMTPLAFDVDLDEATLDSIATRAAAGETVVFARHRHRRKDGSLFPVEVQTSVFWHGGRRFLLKVTRDVSDRVRAEEERERLRQLEADLAHINRVSMMGELAASIAHEVNQPLAGVVSNGSACLRWLAGDVPNLEEAREAARRIVRDGKRAGELIARVRALTRRAATPTEKLDLNQSIQEVLALVGDQGRSAIIRTQFADDLAPVAGDRVQLQQVVLNLVMNAIEAMSAVGERARELVITTRDGDANHVQITVEDSGTGLDPTAMENIFEPFYTTKASGMGMGLSICRSIVQSHGGRLWATAKDGPGAAFHVALPKYRGDERDAGVEAV